MEEQEFRRLLDLFPVVRSRNYYADPELPNEPSSVAAHDEVKEWQSAWVETDKEGTPVKENNNGDPFWEKLRSAAERKVGATEAEKFCNAFQKIYKKLVHEELSLEAAKRIAAQ